MRGQGPLDSAGWARGRAVPGQYHVGGEPGQCLQRGQGGRLVVVEHRGTNCGPVVRPAGWAVIRASPVMRTPRSGR